MSTRAVHAGEAPPEGGAPVVTPITQSSTFYTDDDPAAAVLYTRYGNNPNHEVLSGKVAAMEGTESAIVVGSGMAAAAMSLLSLLTTGDHVVASASLYGGTVRLLKYDLPRLGIDTTFVEGGRWTSVMRKRTRVILVEVPSNPTLRVIDLAPLAKIARERGVVLMVDATFATPVNYRPIEHGADVVYHSATKYLGGHSDVVAGAVAGPASVVDEVRDRMKSFGASLDPHATWLLERGMKTLAVRVERQNATALALARWLEDSVEGLKRVIYPGLPSHPDHALASGVMDGFGGMLSVVVQGGDRRARKVMERFRLIRVAPSLGGVESLASMPRHTSHADTSAEERRALGIDPGFIRLSIGIEDEADLRADLEQALAAA